MNERFDFCSLLLIETNVVSLCQERNLTSQVNCSSFCSAEAKPCQRVSSSQGTKMPVLPTTTLPRFCQGPPSLTLLLEPRTYPHPSSREKTDMLVLTPNSRRPVRYRTPRHGECVGGCALRKGAGWREVGGQSARKAWNLER